MTSVRFAIACYLAGSIAIVYMGITNELWPLPLLGTILILGMIVGLGEALRGKV